MKVLKQNINIILPIFVIGLFVSDFITSIVYKLSPSSFYRYSGGFKLFFECVMLIVIICNFKKLNSIYKTLGVVVFFFVVNQFIIYDGLNYDLSFHFLRGNIYFLNRYIYILIFILFLNSINIKEESYQKAYKYLEIVLIINCIIISLSIIFDINIFKSYENTARFGYVGLFSKPEEAGYLYSIVIIANYYLWHHSNKKEHLFKTFLFVITILLLGQKKMFLFVFLFFSLHLTYKYKYKRIFRILIPLSIAFLYLFRVQIVKFVISYSTFWSNLYKERGLLSTITSTRSDLLQDSINYIKIEWLPINYIVGGIDFNHFKVEFELYDLYLFIGLAGIYFYYYLLRYHFLKKHDIFKAALILILFISSFFSGGLLLSVTATLILYFVANKIMLPKTS